MKKIFFAAVLLFFAFFAFTSEVDAQSCSGGYTSTGLYGCQFNPLLGTYQCNSSASAYEPCSYSSLFGACTAIHWAPESCSATSSGCSVNNRIDSSGSGAGCTLSPPPTAPPGGTPPPGGPPPPPPPPGNCSASCFGGLSNCGEVGRQPAAGTCSAGELCCGFGGGGPPPLKWVEGSFVYSLSNPFVIASATVGQVFSHFIVSFNECCVAYVDKYITAGSAYFTATGTTSTSVGSTVYFCPTCITPWSANLVGTAPGWVTVMSRMFTSGAGYIQEWLPPRYDSIYVAAAPVCGSLNPNVPIPPVCAPNPPLQNGAITWTWPAVPGADQYSFRVDDAITGALIPGTWTGGMVNGQANFNCRPNQTPPDTCSRTTILPPGSYRIVTRSGNSTGTCTLSPLLPYPPVGQPGIDISICAANAWWQSASGSVVSQGNIQSVIPVTCVAPGCTNRLVLDGNSSFPAIAISGTSSVTQTGTGTVSSTNWIAQTSLNGNIPDFSSFLGLVPVSITPSDPGATFGGGAFNSSGATTGDGYHWYYHNGNATISSDINLNAGRKVIFFVDGNLTISGRITYNAANSFFMVLARNSIFVNPAVTTPAGTPTLTGIFYSDGGFSSGAGNGSLSVLGSVVAKGGVTLNRDLGPGNNTGSAENFTISPDLLLNYPATLSFKRPVWREVAP